MNKSAMLLLATLLGAAALMAQEATGDQGTDSTTAAAGDAQSVITGAPYSGTKTFSSVWTLSDGNQIKHSSSEKVYRDSKGRTRTEQTSTSASGSTQTTITIFDPVAGYTYTLNPQTLKATRRAIPAANTTTTTTPAPMHTLPTGYTQTTTDLGTKAVNGLTATGTRTTTTIAAGTIGNVKAIISTHDVWTSTELKIPVEIVDTDPRTGVDTMDLTGVTKTEPDASLFTVPSNYTLVTQGGGSPGTPGGAPGGPGGRH